MPFYTFFMELKGIRLISQIEAASPRAACLKWAKGLNTETIPGFDQKSKLALIEKIKTERPRPIQGTFGAWCVSALIQGKLDLVTFVQTERSQKTDMSQL
jgi:hypothetical protein